MSVAHLSQQVAAAEACLAEAERQHQTAHAEAERHQARLNALQHELDSIADRRREGDKEDSDASRVTLLKLDIAQLESLGTLAQAEDARALQGVIEARDRLATANQELNRVWAQEQAEALESRLRQIEEVFGRGLAELAKLKKRANPRFVAAPAHVYALGDALRRYQQGVIPQ